jgi:hypothetical protein
MQLVNSKAARGRCRAAARARPRRTRAEERQCCVVRAYLVKRLVCTRLNVRVTLCLAPRRKDQRSSFGVSIEP